MTKQTVVYLNDFTLFSKEEPTTEIHNMDDSPKYTKQKK